MNLLLIAGTRPNFIKLAPLYHRLKEDSSFNLKICHTGQHFDKNMSDLIFENLQIPQPDFQLNISGSNVADTIGKTIIEVNNLINSNQFDLIIVFGDVNATVAGAIAGVQNRVKVAHVEAGLRSFDRDMPEEINRVITDHISDILFVTENSGLENLKKEGLDDGKVFFVGNIMIETLINTMPKWQKISFSNNVEEAINTKPIIATFHRPENVDRKENLERVLNVLNQLSKSKKIIFPIHPRTKNRIEQYGLSNLLNNENIITIEPQGYFEFIKLIFSSSLVVTDSGGVQEETSFLNVPCITFRKNTERPVTNILGTNLLLNINDDDYFERIEKHVHHIESKPKTNIPFWDDKVSERIVEVLKTL